MSQLPPAVFKIPTKSPQAARGAAFRRASGQLRAGGTGRVASRGGGEVIELEYGITVYPARSEGGRWRAVWHEAGRREQCEAATEEKLAAKLVTVTARLAADAPNMRRSGADLIAYYLDPDRLPVSARWSRKHAHTQRRLCERFAAPVIAAVACQDIKTEHTQAIVNAAPTASEGNRVRGMVSALVSVGLDSGYLINPRLAKVHWQAGDRPLPAPDVSVAGESVLRPTSTATSSSAPTWPSGGGPPTARERGHGTACGMCSAPPRCSPGSSTRPTCRAWPGTLTIGSRSTCTSAPPSAFSTARGQLPSSRGREIRTRTMTRCEAHPSDELVVPPGDQVVHLTRLLHREPFQMVTAIQQPGHCLWRVRKPLLPQAPDE